MKRTMVIASGVLLGVVLATSGSEAQFVSTLERGHRQFSDPVLAWNAIALQAVADDHTEIFGSPEQGGPTRTARALAIVHAAVYDAVNSIDRSYTPYLTLVRLRPHTDVSIAAAVAAAAHGTLVALYPSQEDVFDEALEHLLARIRDDEAKQSGIEVGRTVAERLLQARHDDGSADSKPHTLSDLPGRHRADPLNPGQGFLTPGWGKVTPFVVQSGFQFRAPPLPALTSPAYTKAYNEVKRLGGDGVNTPTERTDEQTEIGLYWAYDGTRWLGSPPRLYNQIARIIAAQQDNTVVENARFFALINLAMADAGITCWESKYYYDYWRPILGIRESDLGTGPHRSGRWQPVNRGRPQLAAPRRTGEQPERQQLHAALPRLPLGPRHLWGGDVSHHCSLLWHRPAPLHLYIRRAQWRHDRQRGYRAAAPATQLLPSQQGGGRERPEPYLSRHPLEV